MAERIVTGRTGEAHVTSQDDRTLSGSIIGRNKLFILPWGDNLNLEWLGNYKAKLHTGFGVFQGIQFMVDEPIELTFETCGYGESRIDAVVAEYDKDSVSGLESIHVRVIKGTIKNPSDAESYPYLSTPNIWDGDATVYQEPLYYIKFANGDFISKTSEGTLLDVSYFEHIEDKENPHNVTKFQLGLESVDNIPDKEKNVKSAVTAVKLKSPFTLSFTGDLKGSTKIDGYNDVELNAEFKGGQLMPFTYTEWKTQDILTRNKFYELIPNWYNKQGDVIPSKSVISYGYAFLYTSGNLCKVELRIKPEFKDDENPQVVDLLSFSKLDFNLEALHPIVMDYSTAMSSNKLPLYNSRAHLEYVYDCTLNYPKKGSKMFSRKEIPIGLIAKEFDSSGKILSSQLVSDGTSFVSSFSTKNDWEPAIIAAKNGVIAPEWLFIELTFPCKPIGGIEGPDNYIEISATEVSKQNNTMYSGGVE